MGTIISSGWRNKGGTADRECGCGAWWKHWLNFSKEAWPSKCSVKGCSNPAKYGAHIWNPRVEGERIAPFCKDCNEKPNDEEITLEDNVVLVSANRKETCES